MSASPAQPALLWIAARVRRSPRIRGIARRLLISIPVLFGVTLLTFFILDLLPGNAARQLLGADATAEQVAQLEAELNLNRPARERYVEWLQNAVTGDLGRSLASRQPVTDLISERFEVTAQLVAYALALSVCVAVPLALLAAHRPGRLVDRLTMILSMTGLSLANYVLALLLVLVFSVQLGWFPSIGFSPLSEGVLRNIRSLTLPAIATAFPLICFYTRLLRGDLLEQMDEDYVITAQAKGLGPWHVLVRHALRNSLLGLLTVAGLNFGVLIGGTVIIEQIFALPGIGHLLLQAIRTRDATVVQALVLLLAVITVLVNLATDLLYAVLDPRIRNAHA